MIKEIFIPEGVLTIPVMYSEEIRDQEELQKLLTSPNGIPRHYLHACLLREGISQIRYFFAGGRTHQDLFAVIAAEIPDYKEKKLTVCNAQIGLSSRGLFSCINFQTPPPTNSPLMERLLILELVSRIKQEFWEEEILVDWEGQIRYLVLPKHKKITEVKKR